MKTIILSLIGIIAIMTIAGPIMGTPKSPTHQECIKYWEERTSGWNNTPTLDTIHTSSAYCGDVL